MLEELLGKTDAVAVAVEKDMALSIDDGHKGVLVVGELESLCKGLLCRELMTRGETHDGGLGQELEVVIGGIGGGDEDAASPLAKSIGLLSHLFDQMLGGFAVWPEEGEDAGSFVGECSEGEIVSNLDGGADGGIGGGIAFHQGTEDDGE